MQPLKNWAYGSPHPIKGYCGYGLVQDIVSVIVSRAFSLIVAQNPDRRPSSARNFL